mmetsp:Transcript_19814/g.47173  ORF Transcript_19814/g.47173 Transcript_19814/m.47173 type:complete len:154 (-) Transcript_19814:111-572(-)
MFSQVAVRSATRRAATLMQHQQPKHNGMPVRRAGGMPVPQSMKAKPFDGHPTNEGWEPYVQFYTGVSVILLAVNYFFAPDTTIDSWARNEAAARLRLKEKDPDFKPVFGVHYQDLQSKERQEKWDEVSEKEFNPFKEEDDDDDDDDDDEDDDE